MANLPPKPNWADAPDWAVSIGICEFDEYEHFGEWCWCNGINTNGFSNVELRPASVTPC